MKIIGITMGDPASIGPEITAKALADPAVYKRCNPLVVGDVPVMEEALNITGISGKIKIQTASKSPTAAVQMPRAPLPWRSSCRTKIILIPPF